MLEDGGLVIKKRARTTSTSSKKKEDEDTTLEEKRAMQEKLFELMDYINKLSSHKIIGLLMLMLENYKVNSTRLNNAILKILMYIDRADNPELIYKVSTTQILILVTTRTYTQRNQRRETCKI